MASISKTNLEKVLNGKSVNEVRLYKTYVSKVHEKMNSKEMNEDEAVKSLETIGIIVVQSNEKEKDKLDEILDDLEDKLIKMVKIAIGLGLLYITKAVIEEIFGTEANDSAMDDFIDGFLDAIS